MRPAYGAKEIGIGGQQVTIIVDVANVMGSRPDGWWRDRAGAAVAGRIRRDVDSGLASGQVLGTPTLFIDGVVHRGGYDPPTLLAALAR